MGEEWALPDLSDDDEFRANLRRAGLLIKPVDQSNRIRQFALGEDQHKSNGHDHVQGLSNVHFHGNGQEGNKRFSFPSYAFSMPPLRHPPRHFLSNNDEDVEIDAPPLPPSPPPPVPPKRPTSLVPFEKTFGEPSATSTPTTIYDTDDMGIVGAGEGLFDDVDLEAVVAGEVDIRAILDAGRNQERRKSQFSVDSDVDVVQEDISKNETNEEEGAEEETSRLNTSTGSAVMTTVPMCMLKNTIATETGTMRHLPTRSSLRHSRMLVNSTKIHPNRECNLSESVFLLYFS